jgi:hypothetical protein
VLRHGQQLVEAAFLCLDEKVAGAIEIALNAHRNMVAHQHKCPSGYSQEYNQHQRDYEQCVLLLYVHGAPAIARDAKAPVNTVRCRARSMEGL